MPAWWIDPAADDSGHADPLRARSPSGRGTIAQPRMAGQLRSNRQGLRLEGEAIAGDDDEQISAAVAPGTVQLPPDGRPIVLLADAQTVGGYPRLGHVIAADLPRLAQLRPGETLRFQPCDPQTATRLACAARARVARIAPDDRSPICQGESRMKGNIVAALVLIVVGTLFLLNNLGFTNLSLGRLISTWWPAILVVVGLGLLFNRK